MFDRLTSGFEVLDEVVIHELTMIAMVVIYMNVMRRCVDIKALFSVDTRFKRDVLHVVDILQV